MRVSYDGDPVEANRWLGKAAQELARLKQRMATQGLDQGSFQHQLSATAYCTGFVIPGGIEAVHIVCPPNPPPIPGVPSTLYFEFGTSGWPVVTKTTTELDLSFASYSGCVVGLDLRRGQHNNPTIRTGDRPEGALASASAVDREFEVQLIDEPTGYTGAVASGEKTFYPRAVFTSYAPFTPYTGIYVASYNKETPGAQDIESGSRMSFLNRDVGYDVLFAESSYGKEVRPAVLREDADWPRATGVQKVVGGGTYAVYIDAVGTVYAFPVGGVTPLTPSLDQNVDPGLVKKVSIEFPDWAFIPAGKSIDLSADPFDWYANSPDLKWQINHLGTKACCVLHEREAAAWDDAYLADPDTHYRGGYDASSFLGGTGTTERFDGAGTWPGLDTLYSYGRGVFEVDINIEKTGPGLGDFELTVKGRTVRNPRTSDKGTFVVGYAWQDLKKKNIKAGDMLFLDIERRYEPDKSVPDPSYPSAGNWRLSCTWTSAVRWRYDMTPVADPDDPGAYIAFASGVSLHSQEIKDDFNWAPGPDDMYTFLRGPTSLAGAVLPAGWASSVDIDADSQRWSEPYVTGRGKSFFVLRTTDHEILAAYGDSLLAVDLKTASFVLAIDAETTTPRLVSLVAEAPTSTPPYNKWPAAASMPHRISHPGVAVYVQAKLADVLIHPDVPGGAATVIRATTAANPRTDTRSWAYMPANDLSGWSGHAALRDFLMYVSTLNNGFQTLSTEWPARLPANHPLRALSVQERNWWLAGMCEYAPNTLLLLVANPNFGWALYTSEAINRMQTAGTTFFTHPNGSWAYYDATRVYNQYGCPDIFKRPAVEDANDEWGQLDVFDRGGPVRHSVSLSVQFSEGFGVGLLAFPGETGLNYNVGDPLNIDFLTVDDVDSTTFSVPAVSPPNPAAYEQMCMLDRVGGGRAPTTTAPAISNVAVDNWSLVELPHFGFGVLSYELHDDGRGASVDMLNPFLVNIWNDYDTLTPALSGRFTHCIFDKVHLVSTRSGKVFESAFSDLYNSAITNVLDNSDSDTDLLPLPENKGAVTISTAEGDGLAITFTFPDGGAASIDDPVFKKAVLGHSAVNFGQAALRAPLGAGKSLRPRLTNLPGLLIDAFPVAFSTCLMLDF